VGAVSAKRDPLPPGGAGPGPGHPAQAGPGPAEAIEGPAEPRPPAPRLPARWDLLAQGADGQSLTGVGPEHRRLLAIWSDAVELDGRWWRHVSVSLPTTRAQHAHPSPRLPSWAELEWVRRRLIGPDRYAYQVHPPVADYVNLHAGTLHLWACLEGPSGAVLPDFSRGTGSV